MKRSLTIAAPVCVAGCALMAMLSSCGAAKSSSPQTASATEAMSQTAQTFESGAADTKETAGSNDGAATVEITDQNNMTATVEKNPDRVVLTALPLPSIYALTGQDISNIVGIHPGAASAIENSVMASMYPALVGIADNFIDGQNINIEELMALNPDVVMYWADFLEQYKAITGAGIPAVGVKTQGSGDVLTTLESWLKIMGKMYDSGSGNVDEVIAYGREMEDKINKVTATIPEDKKPKVLYLYNHSADKISVSGANFYGDYWIHAGGGINVAGGLDGTPEVNMEQIYEWDPDIIVITTFTGTMPEDLYNNTIDGQDWSTVSAVKNHKVYKEPLGVYRWFPPSGDAPLALEWMAMIFNPDYFHFDFKQDIKDYYKRFYNYTLTDDQVEGILTANPDAAKGANFGGQSGNK